MLDRCTLVEMIRNHFRRHTMTLASGWQERRACSTCIDYPDNADAIFAKRSRSWERLYIALASFPSHCDRGHRPGLFL